MRFSARALMACLLSVALNLTPVCWSQRDERPSPPPPASRQLQAYLQKCYLELFQLARERLFTAAEIAEMREALKRGRELCVKHYKQRISDYDSQLKQAQSQLKKISDRGEDSGRHDLHCRIQNLRLAKSQAEMMAQKAIPIAYDNREAKLQLIEKWPEEYQQIRRELADGSYRKRRWGDVEDIGFREIEPGQEKDIKTGEDAVRHMRENGMIPPAVDNKVVVDYVTELALKVARHSDLRIPLHVTVLNSKEVNAFALPGGFLFVERGLLEQVDDESELAGVLGHEIAHDVARHAHKLMKKATIAQIFYQGAELAALILTGGVVGLGTYYALQYGFYGLGLVLDLKLLGVSREYELEADQLGIQYTWNTGYDPSGFVRFFDKMATQEGYVNGVGWFYDHPPFYQRMVDAERETMFLPPKERLAEQSSAFEEMKKELAGVKQQADKEEKDSPSLLLPEKGCPVPQQTEYKPGMPIESVCPSQESQPAPATKTSQKTKRGPDEHPGSSTTKTSAIPQDRNQGLTQQGPLVSFCRLPRTPS